MADTAEPVQEQPTAEAAPTAPELATGAGDEEVAAEVSSGGGGWGSWGVAGLSNLLAQPHLLEQSLSSVASQVAQVSFGGVAFPGT